MDDLKRLILYIVRNSDKALTIREICVRVNNVNDSFCRNVDGNGARCYYCYKRPRHESQRIRLVKPPCRYNYIEVLKAINDLCRSGKLMKKQVYMRDELSRWGRDKFKLVYISDQQLRKRFKSYNIEKYLINR